MAVGLGGVGKRCCLLPWAPPHASYLAGCPPHARFDVCFSSACHAAVDCCLQVARDHAGCEGGAAAALSSAELGLPALLHGYEIYLAGRLACPWQPACWLFTVWLLVCG